MRPRVRASRRPLALTILLAAGGCGGGDTAPPPIGETLFARLPSSYTGVSFENRVEDSDDFNVFTYRNYYNGGGVALGDLTGDGLPELFLTSNLEENRLYLNRGDFRFEDITEQAGVGGRGAWSTGVTFVDANGDGRLDIYVGYAGAGAPEDRRNELFLHEGLDEDGVPTFREAAAEVGLADPGFTTHAAFFDYDRDGDLDAYVVNNSSRPSNAQGIRNTREVRDPYGGDHLYRNDGGRFVDVSEAAGIYGSEIGFGLGVAVSDIDRDGWPDIYVSNDFFEQDFLYRNRGDGTFAESVEQSFPYVSYSSMGLDVGDIDNDAWPDIYVTDMLPEDHYRLNTTQGFESWDAVQRRIENGYHAQYPRNMLHRNERDGRFSEIGRLAGVSRTDWSWSALIADFDLDGFKDLHVTNGLRRDVTSQDYIAFLGDPRTLETRRTAAGRADLMSLIAAMPSSAVPNYAFRNRGDLTFADASAAWGLDDAGASSGAAYGDLDGDGALDLVVSNVNREASIYRNDALGASPGRRSLRVRLVGEGANGFAIGSRVTVVAGDLLLYQELEPSRGFQSSVEYPLTFGVDTAGTADIWVEWPDGRVTERRSVPTGGVISIEQEGAMAASVAGPPPGGPGAPPPAGAPRRPLVREASAPGLTDVAHVESDFVDFHREPLMPKLVSREGPLLAVADVNGDGLDDVYVGGAKERPGRLLLQRAGGRFEAASTATFEPDALSEDLGAAFFDADGDGDLDLYVVSGGTEYAERAPALQDRLYLNLGAARFDRSEDALPELLASGSRVAPYDFDGDGDTDLFVGGRVVPWRYGEDPQSALLANDGRGRFTDVTADLAPALRNVGMVTDAAWTDVDGDARVDLVVVGEWMPITVFRAASGGGFERMEAPGLERSHGWWNRVLAEDVTGDGRPDLIVGNLGLDTRLMASVDEPLVMYAGDFDRNGRQDQILAESVDGVSYPLALRDDLLAALPSLQPRFPDFESYARATLDDVLSPEQVAMATVKRAYGFASVVARNDGASGFTLIPLPVEAQIGPAYALLSTDLDGDGRSDLLVAGNFAGAQPELGRLGGGYGVALLGDGAGGYEPLRTWQSGFLVPGDARDLGRVRTADGDLYVVTRNDDYPLAFRPAGAATPDATGASSR